MPFPKIVAKVNKHLTNKFMLLFADWVPPFAVVNHVGRRSGRSYRTPVLAFPTGDGYVFALTYGPDVDWVRNLFAAGEGRLEYGGEEIRVDSFRLVKLVEVKALFPSFFRFILWAISVEDCFMVSVISA
ncbi:MAG: nitroreductase family deazaflavin-dependent oxidoreductase [Candidatus Bathyarchaeota archaeon]|nr:nitroreductase family deazaflavin-dependent oxidoreductase [Candidatus Bathyarchaeota archaeon]